MHSPLYVAARRTLLDAAEALAGAGRRGARLGHHGNKTARRARGIEGCLVDNDIMMVGSLDESDDRRMKLAVAAAPDLLDTSLYTSSAVAPSVPRVAVRIPLKPNTRSAQAEHHRSEATRLLF